MKNPNRGASKDLLQRYMEASYERMRVELKCSVELLLKDFDMTWDDIAESLDCGLLGPEVKKMVIDNPQLNLVDLNDIAHIFSCEPYIIFRPRLPWIKS